MNSPLQTIELKCTRDGDTVTRQVGLSNLIDNDGEWEISIHLPTRDEPVTTYGGDALSCLGNAYMHLYSVMNYLDRQGWTFEHLDGFSFCVRDYFPSEGDANSSVPIYDCEIEDKGMIDLGKHATLVLRSPCRNLFRHRACRARLLESYRKSLNSAVPRASAACGIPRR